MFGSLIRRHILGSLGKPHVHQATLYRFGFQQCLISVLLSVDHFEHRRHFFDFAVRHDAEHIAIKMNDTSLMLCFGIKLAQRFEQPKTLVRNKHLDTLETTLFQMPQKLRRDTSESMPLQQTPRNADKPWIPAFAGMT